MVYMLEDVHARLFIAVIVFHSLMVHAANSCDFAFDLWHDMDEEAQALKTVQGKSRSHCEHGSGFLLFTHLRSTTIAYLKDNSQVLFGIEELPVDEFNFAMYLQVNVLICLDGLIELNMRTWGGVLMIMLGIRCPLFLLERSINYTVLSCDQWLLMAIPFPIAYVVFIAWSRKRWHLTQDGMEEACRSLKGQPEMVMVSQKEHQLSDFGEIHLPPGWPPTDRSPPPSPDCNPPLIYKFANTAEGVGVVGSTDQVTITGQLGSERNKWSSNGAKFQFQHQARRLQVLLFVLSYGVAGALGSTWIWNNRMGYMYAVLCSIFVVHCIMWWVSNSLIPWYLAILSAPPKMDPDELQLATGILNLGLERKAAARWKKKKQMQREYDGGKEAPSPKAPLLSKWT